LKRDPKFEPEIRRQLQRRGRFRQMNQSRECLLEARNRFPIGGTFNGSRPGPAEMDDGLVPDFALEVMKTTGEVVRVQTCRV
jgi:hypothetical protein